MFEGCVTKSTLPALGATGGPQPVTNLFAHWTTSLLSMQLEIFDGTDATDIMNYRAAFRTMQVVS